MANPSINVTNPAIPAATPATGLVRPNDATPPTNAKPDNQAEVQALKAKELPKEKNQEEVKKLSEAQTQRSKDYTLSIDDVMDKEGNVNTDKLKSAIENYKKYHKRADNLPKAFVNLGLLMALGKSFFAAHHQRIQEETENLSVFEKPFQKIFNFPADRAAKKFENKVSSKQMQYVYDAVPAFLLNSAHNRYERLNKGLLGKTVTTITKPLRLVFDSSMKFFASFKFIALAIDYMENADPEHNPNPNHELSQMANDIAETGLKFLPFARAITDLNSYFSNTKGNLAQLTNGLGGTVINAMRFKDNWNSFVDNMTEQNQLSGSSDQDNYSLTHKLHNLTSFLNLDDPTKNKVDQFLNKTLETLSSMKFNSKAREENDDRKLQAISKLFTSVSYLGDNRSEGVRDLGNSFMRLSQRAMSLVLDLPAASLLIMKSLSTFNKIKNHEDISQDDLESLDNSLKLKALGIGAQQLMLNTVKRGFGKMHIEFGGVVKSLKDIQWWKTKVDDIQGKLDKFSIPGTGAIFSIFRKLSDSSFKGKAIKELKNNLPDDLVDTSNRIIDL